MSDIKKVAAMDDIVFEKAGITISKGIVFIVEEVQERGIILVAEDGERYMMDLNSFENGFEIVL